MSKNYFFDILINDKAAATVGPSGLKQLHISFGVTDGKPIIKAGGVSEKDDGLMYINWLEEAVDFADSFRVEPSKKDTATSPMITKKLGRGVESTEEDCFCDFCNRTEEEAGKLIRLGDSPQICTECVQRCVEACKSKL